MKEQFISRLLCETQNLSCDMARTILSSLLARMRGERPDEDVFGDPLPKMQIFGDVALIPICGVLQMNVPDWVKKWGLNLTDANDVEEEVDQALSREDVRFIVQHVDSPGGSSFAGEKLYDVFERAGRQKPVFAFSGDGQQMCSSAYQSAAPSRAIYTGAFASVGSIGTYLAMLDDTEYWKMMGLVWNVFRSGEIKGIGEDPLSEAQRAFLQTNVDETGARFRSMVSRYRTSIAKEDMQGQYWWRGEDAARRGFSAGVVKDLGAALVKFRGLV